MTVTVVGEAEAEGEMEVTREVTRTVFERIDVAVVVVVLIDDIMDADNMVVVDISISVFVAAVGSVGSDVYCSVIFTPLSFAAKPSPWILRHCCFYPTAPEICFGTCDR